MDASQQRLREVIEEHVDKGAFRRDVATCIVSKEYEEPEEGGSYPDVVEAEVHAEIDRMVADGVLVESTAESGFPYEGPGWLVIAEWMPRSARRIRERNRVVRGGS